MRGHTRKKTHKSPNKNTFAEKKKKKNSHMSPRLYRHTHSHGHTGGPGFPL